jgi:hypothetical protein
MDAFPTEGTDVDPGGLVALGQLQRRVAPMIDEGGARLRGS